MWTIFYFAVFLKSKFLNFLEKFLKKKKIINEIFYSYVNIVLDSPI